MNGAIVHTLPRDYVREKTDFLQFYGLLGLQVYGPKLLFRQQKICQCDIAEM